MKKTHKVVMLPTEEAQPNGFQIYNRGVRGLYLPITGAEGRRLFAQGIKPQHLYIVSDEKIKKGDWCYANQGNEIFQWKHDGQPAPECFAVKVIATTDSSLRKECETAFECEHSCSGGYGGHEYGHPCIGIKLPKIPESFIKAYVEQGGIDEVQLEYDEIYYDDDGKGNVFDTIEHNLKLRDDGTVIVHQAKMYSREEVIEFAKAYGNAISKHTGVDNDGEHCYCTLNRDKWIEENL